MSKLPGKWGGIRKNSGRPKGGIRDARRQIQAAFFKNGVDGCAQVITDMILVGRGDEVLKLWYDSISVYAESNKAKSEQTQRSSVLVEAHMRPLSQVKESKDYD